MELNLPVTVTIVVVIMAIFAFANWRSRQPAQPLKVRLVNYHVVQMFCLILLLVMLSHLVSLLTGSAFKGRQGF
jgi:hypothetical protein